MIQINGIMPENDHLINGTYPFSTNYYAVMRSDELIQKQFAFFSYKIIFNYDTINCNRNLSDTRRGRARIYYNIPQEGYIYAI